MPLVCPAQAVMKRVYTVVTLLGPTTKGPTPCRLSGVSETSRDSFSGLRTR